MEQKYRWLSSNQILFDYGETGLFWGPIPVRQVENPDKDELSQDLDPVGVDDKKRASRQNKIAVCNIISKHVLKNQVETSIRVDWEKWLSDTTPPHFRWHSLTLELVKCPIVYELDVNIENSHFKRRYYYGEEQLGSTQPLTFTAYVPKATANVVERVDKNVVRHAFLIPSSLAGESVVSMTHVPSADVLPWTIQFDLIVEPKDSDGKFDGLQITFIGKRNQKRWWRLKQPVLIEERHVPMSDKVKLQIHHKHCYLYLLHRRARRCTNWEYSFIGDLATEVDNASMDFSGLDGIISTYTTLKEWIPSFLDGVTENTPLEKWLHQLASHPKEPERHTKLPSGLSLLQAALSKETLTRNIEDLRIRTIDLEQKLDAETKGKQMFQQQLETLKKNNAALSKQNLGLQEMILQRIKDIEQLETLKKSAEDELRKVKEAQAQTLSEYTKIKNESSGDDAYKALQKLVDFDALREEYNTQVYKLAKYENDLKLHEEKATQQAAELARLTQLVEDAQKQHVDLQGKLNSAETDLKTEKGLNSTLQTTLQTRDTALRAKQARVDDLEKQVKDALEKVTTKEGELRQAQQDIANTKTELAQAKQLVLDKEKLLDDKEDELKIKETELINEEAEIVRLDAELVTKEAEIVRLGAELATKEAEIVRLGAELAKNIFNLTKLQADMLKLSNDLSDANAKLTKFETWAKNIKSILDRSEKGMVDLKKDIPLHSYSPADGHTAARDFTWALNALPSAFLSGMRWREFAHVENRSSLENDPPSASTLPGVCVRFISAKDNDANLIEQFIKDYDAIYLVDDTAIDAGLRTKINQGLLADWAKSVLLDDARNVATISCPTDGVAILKARNVPVLELQRNGTNVFYWCIWNHDFFTSGSTRIRLQRLAEAENDNRIWHDASDALGPPSTYEWTRGSSRRPLPDRGYVQLCEDGPWRMRNLLAYNNGKWKDQQSAIHSYPCPDSENPIVLDFERVGNSWHFGFILVPCKQM